MISTIIPLNEYDSQVSWDHDIPNWMENHPVIFQENHQSDIYIYINPNKSPFSHGFPMIFMLTRWFNHETSGEVSWTMGSTNQDIQDGVPKMRVYPKKSNISMLYLTITMENHNDIHGKPYYKRPVWPVSIAMLNYQRDPEGIYISMEKQSINNSMIWRYFGISPYLLGNPKRWG